MYTVKNITKSLQTTLHQYLEADYHIWEKSLIIARRNLFNETNISYSIPRLEASPRYKSGKTFSEMRLPEEATRLLTDLSYIKGSGVYKVPRAHQINALESFLSDKKELIVATGTGSGKTESFLYPIIGLLAMEKNRGPDVVKSSGTRVILLYPMNALVNDQLTRLRKMFGNKEVIDTLIKHRGRQVTFGVYTSKTDYPGKRSSKRDLNLIQKLNTLYTGKALNKRDELLKEGLWPSKDIEQFIASNLNNNGFDVEILTRHEIQSFPPDILITNYSMLEYMLARPIERSIFEKTSDWLNLHQDNTLTIVLDEAHMYRGVVGAEVAFLIRRLLSRLGISRDRVKFILTSASLGSTEDDSKKAIEFACDLTGQEYRRNGSFELIRSEIDYRINSKLPNQDQINNLLKFDLRTLQNIHTDFTSSVDKLKELVLSLGLGDFGQRPMSIEDLKDELYKKLEIFPPAAYLANELTGKPISYEELELNFLNNSDFSLALENLLGLCSFAQEKSTDQVYLPIRLHLMYRGLSGLFACVNPNCDQIKNNEEKSLVGKVYSRPALNCKCGGRIFEILTHRDCGAAFIRGFISENSEDFLLDQQSISFSREKLLEAHFLIEPRRSSHSKNIFYKYIHVYTGKIVDSPKNEYDYIQVGVSDAKNADIGNNKTAWSFNKKCPVCSRKWQHKKTEIQDLTTKGEAPFAYLLRTQVVDQPASKTASEKFPLAGRKALVFSDGRQKAARLARDIPRNVERDIFRICIVLAINKISDYEKGGASLHPTYVYVCFLIVLIEKNIKFFDGEFKKDLIVDIKRLQSILKEGLDDNEPFSLRERLTETWNAPAPFNELLLTNLCKRYYSLSALTLGVIVPKKKSFNRLLEDCKELNISGEDLLSLASNWLARNLESGNYAFDKNIDSGVRRIASGIDKPSSEWGNPKGNKNFYQRAGFEHKSKELEDIFLKRFCGESGGKFFIDPAEVMLDLKIHDIWKQCSTCTKLFILSIKETCPHCGSSVFENLDPATSEYLRARKSFYRDPVIRAINGDSFFNIEVEEHTAQLSYRDDSDNVSTNEFYERRFKDILVNEDDDSVDILSCTTTMEVGVDIGSLIAVSMRNVPPARQNYQQRAGRAGRRGAAISTVLTFAQNGSHDSYYFENPDEIISGNPIVPEIDISNKKIILRHVSAAIIQSFFHRLRIDIDSQSNDLLSVLGLTRDFYINDADFTFQSLKGWVGSKDFTEHIAHNISKWIPSHNLDEVFEIAANIISTLESKKPIDFLKEKSFEEKFLNHLFECDLLPTYAFPRHICTLQIEDSRSNVFEGKIKILESPQQGLSTALTEYAPGRLVVVNKKTYRIGTVAAKTGSKEKNRAKLLFEKRKQYLQCPNCLFTQSYYESVVPHQLCIHCGYKEISLLDIIQPEVVYPDGRKEVDEFQDEDIYTSATSAQLPFVGSTIEGWRNFKENAKLISLSNQELVSVNKGYSENPQEGGFWVCEECGKASAEEKLPLSPHRRDYHVFGLNDSPINYCRGSFAKVNLGYTFNSDVFILNLLLEHPFSDISDGIVKEGLITAATTLSEAILKQSSITLEIDPSEMNCGTRFMKIDGASFLDIFIYDTSAGGAGYAKMVGDHFNSIFSGSLKHLNSDCCDTSCYRCLQHYSNRWNHSRIDKQYGKMLWNSINENSTPNFYDSNTQFSKSIGLIELFKLEGWSLSTKEKTHLIFTKDSYEIKVLIFPILINSNYVIEKFSGMNIYLSDFEVQRNIPGAFSKIMATI